MQLPDEIAKLSATLQISANRMSNCYVLLPGARLAPDLAARVSSETQGLLDEFGKGAETCREQTLVTPVCAHAAHYAWLWRVLGQKSDFPPVAPLLWRGFDAPHLSEAMALLTPYVVENDRIVPVSLAEEETVRLFDALRSVAGRHGARLQLWEGRFFMTSKTDFALEATPAPVLAGLPAADLVLAGADAEKLRAFLSDCEEAVRGVRPLSFHLSDAGRGNLRVRPSVIRALWTDDTIVRGLAVAAGLRPDTIGPLSRPMPPSPPGDAVALWDDLALPARTGDLAAWEAAVPILTERWRAIRAVRGRFDRFIPVFFGRTDSATLLPPESGLKALLTRPSVAARTWLFDRADGSECA